MAWYLLTEIRVLLITTTIIYGKKETGTNKASFNKDTQNAPKIWGKKCLCNSKDINWKFSGWYHNLFPNHSGGKQLS